jgi:RHS repeat-associated protein
VEVSWSDREEVWQAEHDGLCRLTEARCGDRRTEFFWDGDRLAAEQAADGRLRLYVYAGADSLLPLVLIDFPRPNAHPLSGQAFYPFHDQIGLPQWIEDSRGEVVWRAAATDAYGLIDVAAGSQLDYRLRFPGHLLIAETGLHYNRFRTYDSALGRYLQPDPSGQRGGINLYAYSGNPLVLVDLLGLHAKSKQDNLSTGEGNPQGGVPGAKPPGGLPSIEDARATLPPYDGKTTHGVLITNEGAVVPLQSGNQDPRFSNVAAGHVEGKAAIVIRDTNSTGGVVMHNNPEGTCPYCRGGVATLLPEGKQLLVIPPDESVPKSPGHQAVPAVYTGNSNTPAPGRGKKS